MTQIFWIQRNYSDMMKFFLLKKTKTGAVISQAWQITEFLMVCVLEKDTCLEDLVLFPI